MLHCRFRWIWLVWMVIGTGAVAGAQDLCQKGGGGFSINGVGGSGPIIGCAPFKVDVSNTIAGANNINFVYDYKGEATPTLTTSTTFTYTKPGKYRILQVGSSGATGITACREVVVRDITPPKVTVTSCPGGIVKLAFADDSTTRQYDQIELDWNDGSAVEYINKGDALQKEHDFFGTGTRIIRYRATYKDGNCSGSQRETLRVQVDGTKVEKIAISQVDARADGSIGLSFEGLAGVESEVMVKTGTGNYVGSGVKSSKAGKVELTLQSLDPKKVHCLKIATTDACGNVTESNEVCTVVLNGKAESERNILTWSQYPQAGEFRSYELLRNGNRIKRFTKVEDVSYVDNDVECGVSYRYQIVATVGKVESKSAPVEVTAKSDLKPGAITQAIVSVEQDGSVSLVAFPPSQGTTPTYKMIFERSTNPDGGFQEVGATENTNRYSDVKAKTSERSYCYRIMYENACGNRSEPSPPICTIFLKNEGSILKWTGEPSFTDNVGGYFVIKLNKGGAASETGVGSNVNYDPQFDDPNEQEFEYQIRSRSKNGAFLSYSNVILYRREAALFLPDAFSPNGDGINDAFKPNGSFYDNFQMIIYNRWGQSVFQTTDATTGWDGTINNDRAPQGQYVYKVIIRDNTGKEFVKNGTVLLLR
ncbi:gliding motility-associated C-terminal domain-containing protein [Persicitalea sp.]|uniref:T9SS type B sorting domain-containing protein n=1 Tax=Persicitalea sp. TaxID=3100273 RepID=UPI003594654A